MKFMDAQYLTHFARLLKDHAEIVSGAYKFRTTQQASGYERGKGFSWRDLTDDEKLKDVLGTMGRRIEFMQEIEDGFSADNGSTPSTQIWVKDQHCLIYGSLPDPLGCCEFSAQKSIMAVEPDAKFRPVERADCPFCGTDSK